MPSLDDLGLNRFITKGNQSNAIPGAAGMAVNSSTTTGGNFYDSNNFDTKDANQIQTATVISNCFIRTTDLPARVEMSGNDIRLYDDSSGGSSLTTDDTASINFIRSDDVTKFFTINKITSIGNDLDNVMQMYYSPPEPTFYNSLFVGRSGDGLNRNTGNITLAVDFKSAQAPFPGNGLFGVEVSENSVTPPGFGFAAGDTRLITGGVLTTGFSAVVNADDGGLAGIAYSNVPKFYAFNTTTIGFGVDIIPDTDIAYDIGSATNRIRVLYATTLGIDYIVGLGGVVFLAGSIIPDTDNAYDLGAPTFRFNAIYSTAAALDNILATNIATSTFSTGTFSNSTKSVFNGSVVACPLPTVENALEVIRKIPEPTKVGNRGHYGDRLYFDDLTFPEEVLLEIDGVKEIEHTHMIGLLVKAVVELTKEVDYLKRQFKNLTT